MQVPEQPGTIAAFVVGAAGALYGLVHLIRKTLIDANRDSRLVKAEDAVYRNYAGLIEQMRQEILLQREEILRQRDVIQKHSEMLTAQTSEIITLKRQAASASQRITELIGLLQGVKYGKIDPIDIPTSVISERMG